MESEDEPTSTTAETFYQLSCFIEKGLASLRQLHYLLYFCLFHASSFHCLTCSMALLTFNWSCIGVRTSLKQDAIYSMTVGGSCAQVFF